MQVNKVNFLRWNSELLDPGLPDVPYAYWRDRTRCDMRPIFLPGEACAFYINSDTGFLYDNFADLRLQLISMDNTIQSDGFAQLNQHFLPEFAVEGRYNIWSDFVIPFIATDGNHRLRIVRGSDGTVLLTSNIVNVRKDQQKLYETTTFVRFRHDRFFYNIRYHDIPAFYQKFRLGMSRIDEQNGGTDETYTRVTTGRHILLESVEDKEVKFETYYFDNAAHDAAASMIRHSFVEFNGDIFSFKEQYRRNPTLMTKVSKGEFSMFDEAFAAINRC